MSDVYKNRQIDDLERMCEALVAEKHRLRTALERIGRYPWDNPDSNDATIVGELARSALLPP